MAGGSQRDRVIAARAAKPGPVDRSREGRASDVTGGTGQAAVAA